MGRAVGGSPGVAVVAAKSQAGAEESFSVTRRREKEGGLGAFHQASYGGSLGLPYQRLWMETRDH